MEKQHKTIPTLSDKRIIIMGGSSGLGLATAQAAAAEGAKIVIVSSNRQRIDDALSTLDGIHEGHAINLSEEKNIREFFASIGSFDHLVYTAAENISLTELSAMDMEQARLFWNLRYWGAYASVKYAAPHIRRGGSISLTGGIAGARPGRSWTLAASICGAMEGLTRALAVELAPIRVNSVVPGVVRTPLWNSMPEDDRRNLYATIGDSLLVKRVGEAEDIARTFIYLMKQEFGTGQNLIVDGGAVLV